MINLLRKFRAKKQVSYSQSGEDLIVNYIFENLDIKHPTYIDIGAHHSSYLNNTFYFYNKGCRGICIEPDPELYKDIKVGRKSDICLNVGLGSKKGIEKFFVMNVPTLNTFSESEAQNYLTSENYGKIEIKKIISVPIETYNSVVKKYRLIPNFVSLDTEGLDLEIIMSMDFNKYAPDVICVETARAVSKCKIVKLSSIFKFLKLKGYFVYADTMINTIFVKKDSWRRKYEEIKFQ